MCVHAGHFELALCCVVIVDRGFLLLLFVPQLLSFLLCAFSHFYGYCSLSFDESAAVSVFR